MNKDTIIYWATTGILGAMMLFSAAMYFTNPDAAAAFQHLGYPDYFRVELGAAKIVGALVLLIPAIPSKIKDFAYTGFAIVFVSAAVSHLASGDGISAAIAPLVFLTFLTVSYLYAQKRAAVA